MGALYEEGILLLLPHLDLITPILGTWRPLILPFPVPDMMGRRR